MVQIFFLVIKFSLLIIIYVFIFKVFQLMVKDLRRTSEKQETFEISQSVVSGAELVVTKSDDHVLTVGKIIKIGGTTGIGRGRDNQVRLADSFVSNNHAQIIFKNGIGFLEDLNSINGTYINGIRVTEPEPLKHGDSIKIAGVTFKFVRWEYEME